MVSIHTQLNVFQHSNHSSGASTYSDQQLSQTQNGETRQISLRQSSDSVQSQQGIEVSSYVELSYREGGEQQRVAATSVEKYQAIGKQASGSNTAAAAILKFVDAQLARDLKAGFSEQQLQSRLQSGAEGFVEGFTEGLDQVEALGWDTPAVAAELKETFAKVSAGFATLAQKYAVDPPEGLASAEKTIPQAGNVTAAAEKNTPLNPGRSAEAINSKAAVNMSSLSSRLDSMAIDTESTTVAAAREQQIAIGPLSGVGAPSAASQKSVPEAGFKAYEFAVTTADGDQVTVSAYSEFARSEFGDQRYERNLFDFTVEGELDEGELMAINDLLGQVNQVADLFFNGNVYSAYEEALEIGFDNPELVQFSFNLAQAQVSRAEETYREVQDLEPVTANPEVSRMQVVGEFVNRLSILQQGLEQMGLNFQIVEDLFISLDQRAETGEKAGLGELTQRLSPYLGEAQQVPNSQ